MGSPPSFEGSDHSTVIDDEVSLATCSDWGARGGAKHKTLDILSETFVTTFWTKIQHTILMNWPMFTNRSVQRIEACFLQKYYRLNL